MFLRIGVAYPCMSEQTTIQFISADELQALAERDKESRRSSSLAGMIEDMADTLEFIDTAMKRGNQPKLMVQWALTEPGEFFKLKAKLLSSNKEQQHVHRIQIGLPMTELDALPPGENNAG